MSAPLYGTRPPLTDPSPPAQAAGLSISSRVIRLDPGWFSLSLMPSPGDRGSGLPGVRISLPPGPPGRRETVSISMMRGDGWMTVTDEPAMIRVAAGGGEVLVTQYGVAGDPAASQGALKLVRLNAEAAADTQSGAVAPTLAAAPPTAEIVAHIEGVGDVDGRIGDWVGMRGSGRSIEGFSLTPRQGISTQEFDLRAVLGREWLSPWIPGGRFCGSRGLALPLRGFCVRLHPAAAMRYDLACYARFVDGSEAGPVSPDALVAAPSLAALEAFQFQLRPRLP
jgi:hypothetical protein